MKPSFTLVLCLALFAATGCRRSQNARAAPRSAQPQPAGRLQGRAHIGAQPGVFDYYVFNLSWSPEFCETHPGSEACAARPGFVVHGLWPQNNDGTYPDDCDNPARPTNAAAYIDLIPTISLMEHEWIAHGTCTGLNPDAYFEQVRAALKSFEIPSTFAATVTPPPIATPAVILNQFRGDNPSFPRSSFVLTCRDNQLTGIDVCFDKHLNPAACRDIPSCRARAIKITQP